MDESPPIKSSTFSDKLASFLVDSSSSKNKYLLYVLILTFIGFILRLIAALNLDVLADDMLYASQSAGIWHTKILSTIGNPPLFFYLTDLAYKVFGYTTFASRFWPLIFGTLLIPLIYLITKKFFNEKISVLAALFVTFSTFLIKLTYTEQSLVVLFFSMFGIYLGLEYIDKEKIRFLCLSVILFGLALLTKYSASFFILSFLIFAPIYAKSKGKKILKKKNIKILITFFLILIIFALPLITFNYLLYKDKGVVDYYVSRVVKIKATENLYNQIAGHDRSFFDNIKEINSYNNLTLPFKTDVIIAIFSLLGLFIMFKRKEKIPLIFIFLFMLIPFILQSAGSPLPKHFVFMPFILSIPAAYGLNPIYNKIKAKRLLLSIIILILLLNLIYVHYGTPDNYLTKSPTSQLKSYINNEVKTNDLLVFDPRIYTARTFWLATDHHFMELGAFNNFFKTYSDYGSTIPINIYFIECYPQDCGWGNIHEKQSLNQSSENLFNQIKSIAANTVSINEKSNIFSENHEVYRIYSGAGMFDPQVLQTVDSSQSFFAIPYLYKDLRSYPFNYTTYSPIDSILNKISYYIIWIAVILSFYSVFLIFSRLKDQ